MWRPEDNVVALVPLASWAIFLPHPTPFTVFHCVQFCLVPLFLLCWFENDTSRPRTPIQLFLIHFYPSLLNIQCQLGRSALSSFAPISIFLFFFSFSFWWTFPGNVNETIFAGRSLCLSLYRGWLFSLLNWFICLFLLVIPPLVRDIPSSPAPTPIHIKHKQHMRSMEVPWKDGIYKPWALMCNFTLKEQKNFNRIIGKIDQI